MSESNIERFDQLTGVVFSRLYNSFPITLDLNVMEFDEILSPNMAMDPASIYAGGEVFDFFTNTIEWLIEAGYIVSRQDSSYAYTFERCTLTAKALEILKATPSSLGGETLGGTLAAAVKDGATSKLKDLASEVLSKGYGFATTAAINWANSQ